MLIWTQGQEMAFNPSRYLILAISIRSEISSEIFGRPFQRVHQRSPVPLAGFTTALVTIFSLSGRINATFAFTSNFSGTFIGARSLFLTEFQRRGNPELVSQRWIRLDSGAIRRIFGGGSSRSDRRRYPTG